MDRKLTTILAADIAGFSRLVGLDEEVTLAAQRAHRAELVDAYAVRLLPWVTKPAARK